MNENVKKLLELVKANPDLPIVPMVDAEICGDDYGTYMERTRNFSLTWTPWPRNWRSRPSLTPPPSPCWGRSILP